MQGGSRQEPAQAAKGGDPNRHSFGLGKISRHSALARQDGFLGGLEKAQAARAVTG
jgi:hypothetical protein